MSEVQIKAAVALALAVQIAAAIFITWYLWPVQPCETRMSTEECLAAVYRL